MGGTIAQQVARSILIHGADKITSNALDIQQRKDEEARRNAPLKDTVPDEYWGAFLTSGFSTISPVSEPLPADATVQDTPAAPPPSQMKETPLVRVEIWNLLIGEEKRSVLEKAYVSGAHSLPPPNEWQRWQVATGAIANGPDKQGEKNNPITFLIPPEFGKISSGKYAVVEMAGPGELHVTRYLAY